MRVLTAIPVYNEEQSIACVLEETRKYTQDILVVNDGSTDNTASLLSGENVVTHEFNIGYGAAIQTAFWYAQRNKYDVLITIDADGQHRPSLIPQFVAAMKDNDIVSGSRYLDCGSVEAAPESRRKINQEITAWFNQKFGWSTTDSFCGMKAYSVSALSNFRITEFGYAGLLQVWVQAAILDLKIEELPVPLIYFDAPRSFGVSLDDARRRRDYCFEVIGREMERPITNFGRTELYSGHAEPYNNWARMSLLEKNHGR